MDGDEAAPRTNRGSAHQASPISHSDTPGRLNPGAPVLHPTDSNPGEFPPRKLLKSVYCNRVGAKRPPCRKAKPTAQGPGKPFTSVTRGVSIKYPAIVHTKLSPYGCAPYLSKKVGRGWNPPSLARRMIGYA